MLQPDRDGSVGGHATTIDGAGNSIQIKQEMKLDGEGYNEHNAAAVAANSLHSSGFPAAGQPGQPTTVAAFNTYYETGAGTNAGKIIRIWIGNNSQALQQYILIKILNLIHTYKQKMMHMETRRFNLMVAQEG